MTHKVSSLSKKLCILLGDIRCWILLFFLIRLIGISTPPLEGAHTWRQTTGIMIYKNFYNDSANVLYPKVDFAGNKTGITPTEFPLLPYLSYLSAKVFGFQDWYGRLINLIFTSLGIFFFFKIIALYFDRKKALYSSLLLLTSIWFMYARKSMPDTFSTSLVIIAIYYAMQYLTEGKPFQLLIYGIVGTLGVLSKLPAIILMSILIIPFLSKDTNTKKRIYLSLASLIILVSTYLWYYVWVPYLLTEYQFHHYFFGLDIVTGFHKIVEFASGAFQAYYFNAFMGFGGSILFLIGLIYAVAKKDKRIIIPFSILFAFQVYFMLKSGWTFTSHSYYIIPFVPIMALIGGYLLAEIKKKYVAAIIISLVMIESFANQQHDLFLRKSEVYKTKFNTYAKEISCKNDLFATNGGNNPQQLYFINRRGWTLNNEEFSKESILKQLKTDGCKYIFINKRNGNPSTGLTKIFENEDVIIYDL